MRYFANVALDSARHMHRKVMHCLKIWSKLSEKLMQSLLSHVKKSEVLLEPFPHIVVYNPLEPALCEQLIEDFPSIEIVAQGAPCGSNQRFSYPALASLGDTRVSSLWQKFVQAHVTQEFLNEFLYLFRESICSIYENFETEFGQLETLKAGLRGFNSFDDADILLDAQICVNTPVKECPSSVRRGHVDLADKLFAGLFYLRHPQDHSTGGNLELYKFKTGKVHGFKGQFIDDRHIECVKSLQYESNVLVLLLNSPFSLHGVSVREATDFPRLFFNLVGEVKTSLFDLNQYQESKSILNAVATTSKNRLRQLRKLTTPDLR